jgi:hypothetical protein
VGVEVDIEVTSEISEIGDCTVFERITGMKEAYGLCIGMVRIGIARFYQYEIRKIGEVLWWPHRM